MKFFRTDFGPKHVFFKKNIFCLLSFKHICKFEKLKFNNSKKNPKAIRIKFCLSNFLTFRLFLTKKLRPEPDKIMPDLDRTGRN